MPRTIHAVFENGVFRPTEPVDLPERTRVEFELKVATDDVTAEGRGLSAVYEILSERYASGETDTAARHDEHQP